MTSCDILRIGVVKSGLFSDFVIGIVQILNVLFFLKKKTSIFTALKGGKEFMLNNQTIVISGGTRGIGYAIAQVFASHGWRVFTAGRSKGDLEKMQETWQNEYPKSQLYGVSADLSTKKGCHDFVSNIKKYTDHVHVLVNNIGQFALGTLLGGEEDQLAHFLSTNVLSAHYLTRGLRSLLSADIHSQLFTIGSVAADNWPSEMAAYALSKVSLHAWHRGIRKELKEQGIGSVLIIPGATFTSSWDGVDIDPNDLLAPEDIAQLVWENWENKGSQEEVTIVK